MTGEMHIHSTKKSCETVAETKQQKKCFCQKSWMEHLLDSECRNGAFKVFKAATYVHTNHVCIW